MKPLYSYSVALPFQYFISIRIVWIDNFNMVKIEYQQNDTAYSHGGRILIPEQLGHQMGDKAQDVDSNSVHTSDIRCHEFLGGLLKSYIRRAA